MTNDLPISVETSAPKLLLDMCTWLLATNAVQGETIGNLNIPAVLEYRVKTSNKEATFIFKVKGDSMINAGIYQGDALVVDRSIEARHNNVVVAEFNNEFTVKRLYKRGSVVKLIAENNLYPPILIKGDEELSIWGVVTFNLHKLY
jgi:DNA polymerase V